MTDRISNETIPVLRGKIRSIYHAWNHSKKKEVASVPQDATEEDIKNVREHLNAEIFRLAEINSSSSSLVEELKKELDKCRT